MGGVRHIARLRENLRIWRLSRASPNFARWTRYAPSRETSATR